MQILNNISLLKLNTFGIDASAKYYVEIHNLNDLKALIKSKIYKQSEKLILGGGSNILLTQNFNGLVVKNCINGIEIVKEDDKYVWIKAGAGVIWHEFVLDCINNDRGGLENLSLIPGTVGAAPMQNIGAYGVEIKDHFESLEAFDVTTGKLDNFDNESCEFGYRESIFKHKVKSRHIIISATFKLTKELHSLNLSYGAIKDTLNQQQITDPSIKDISNAVIKIRQSKLPDPSKIGNAGSFFKNPTISNIKYEGLKEIYPSIPSYQLPNNQVKIPAGWLIEQCGWKGKTIGDIGVHKHQALVIVNYGKGKGSDVKKLAFEIQQSVLNKFSIKLTPEVNFVPAID